MRARQYRAADYPDQRFIPLPESPRRRFTPIIERLRKLAGVENTGPQANVRPEESIFPKAAPDPPRDSAHVNEGKVSGYPPHIAVWLGFQPAMMPATWEEDRFGGFLHDRLLTPNIGAWDIRGHMQEVGVRPNIERPPAIAYGSLFALDGRNYYDQMEAT